MTTPTGPTINHADYLGASDIGAVAGQNPFRSGLDVWAEKTGLAVERETTIPMEIGNGFERPGLEIYARRMGRELTFPGTLIHPEERWAGATPDAIEDNLAAVECKIVGFYSERFWGPSEDGPDGVPAHVLCQVHWQSWIARTMIAPCEYGKVVAFFGTEMRVFEVPIDEDFLDGLRDIGYNFWKINVLQKTMPTIEGSTARDIIAALHPRNIKDELDPMTTRAEALARRYDAFRDDIADLKKEQAVIAAQLQDHIGDRAGYEGNGIKTTWKARQKPKTSWEQVAEELGNRVNPDVYKAAVEHHTAPPKGRTLNVYIKKGKV